jgi:hypothetical protein
MGNSTTSFRRISAWLNALAAASVVALAGGSQAAGVLGQGVWETTLKARDVNGNPVAMNDAGAAFYYDTALNITWLRDWSAASGSTYDSANGTIDGRMTWVGALGWASSLTYFGGGWRLPTIVDTGAAGCFFAYSGADCGFNVQTKSGNLNSHADGDTVYSELAHMWYVTLGNKGQFDIIGNPQTGWGLSNLGPFQGIQGGVHWSGIGYVPYSTHAWDFNILDGFQYVDDKANPLYAVAVRPGDVLIAVPEPQALALMLVGLCVLAGSVWRRRKT